MSERSGSERSDSEKLLVLDRDDANLFTEFTRSIPLPWVETTIIHGVVHSSIWVFQTSF